MDAGGGNVDENIISNAVSGALNPDSREALKHAEQYYESIRKMKTDIDKITKNTGYTEDYIFEVKKHLFLEKHDLGGENPEYFHPDYEIGQSWQRLINGKNIQSHDYILLKHEYAERQYMSKGFSQREAHDRRMKNIIILSR